MSGDLKGDKSDHEASSQLKHAEWKAKCGPSEDEVHFYCHRQICSPVCAIVCVTKSRGGVVVMVVVKR